jgi:hypothetical protein
VLICSYLVDHGEELARRLAQDWLRLQIGVRLVSEYAMGMIEDDRIGDESLRYNLVP